MSAQLQPEQPVFEGVTRIYPLAYLLQKGLDYIQKGNSAEAATLFTLVQEQLTSSLGEFTDLLDTFLHAYSNYKQIEWTLQEASMRFASAYLEFQARMTSLEAALSTMMRNATSSTEYPDLPDGDGGHTALSLSSMTTYRLQGASPEMPPPLTNRNANSTLNHLLRTLRSQERWQNHHPVFQPKRAAHLAISGLPAGAHRKKRCATGYAVAR